MATFKTRHNSNMKPRTYHQAKPFSLHGGYRNGELKRIMVENDAFLKRL